VSRVDTLWPQLVSFENLLQAAHGAARGKRSRPDVATFLLDLEPEVLRLKRELESGTYTPGPYRTFLVQEAKPRLISAAPFRDRVVHHALTRVIEPHFDIRFSPFSYACRKGFGTHRALARARQACRRYRYVLKCDVRKYFASIDHAILLRLLARVIACQQTLGLLRRIVASSNPQEPALWYFAGDDLFTPHERRRGIPLGNQTSQFFANVYLESLDRMIVRTLRPAAYVRYVDDLLLFDNDKPTLGRMRTAVTDRLTALRLKLHDRKSRVFTTREGVSFLGFRLFPDHARLLRGNVVRFRRRLRRMQRAFACGELPGAGVDQRVRAWVAHAEHGDTWRLREQVFAEYTFRRSAV